MIMPFGRIELSANTARELDLLIDYVQAVMGEAVDLDAPRLYRGGKHVAFGQISLAAATLELPARAGEQGGGGAVG